MTQDLAALLLERDFLWRLIELSHHEDPKALVEEALQIALRVSGARHGLIELEPGGRTVRFAASTDALDATGVRHMLSSTIIEAALASGRTVETRAAFGDPRFAEAPSVRAKQIDAVVCVPIGREPRIGVVYLQGTTDGRRFDPDVIRLCEQFARHLSHLGGALARLSTPSAPDPTARWRERLVGSEAIVGSSPALAAVLKAAATAAPLDVGVLITGPSGSGKTALAKLIASNGPRAKKPFVALSCANLPRDLVESELFGALPGAHSTANKRVIGKVQSADGGTLFLDEIAELDLTAQAKLLQFLQDGSYFPLGSARPERADVRVIAATNADLHARIEAGTFREDLFYRLCVVEMLVPPLEDRRLDIRALAESFLADATARLALPPMTCSQRAISALEQAEWPGNIRQLRHCVEAAAVRAFADEVQVIEPTQLFPGRPLPDARSTYHEIMRGHQRQVLKAALAQYQWNVTETAEALGLGRSSLYQMIKNLELERS